jgi:hypothetical protein
VDKVRGKISNFIHRCSEDTSSYTLESWFKHAQKLWEFTDGFVSLTDYNTLEEKQEDIDLFGFIKKLITKNFNGDKIEPNNEMINKIVE